jgi:hypothetical protein
VVAQPSAPPAAEPKADIRSFADVIRLADEHREALLSSHLRNNVHFVRLEPGSLEFRPDENAPRDLAQQISRHLEAWTGSRWIVAVSSEEGAATVAEQERREDETGHWLRYLLPPAPAPATLFCVFELPAGQLARGRKGGGRSIVPSGLSGAYWRAAG